MRMTCVPEAGCRAGAAKAWRGRPVPAQTRNSQAAPSHHGFSEAAEKGRGSPGTLLPSGSVPFCSLLNVPLPTRVWLSLRRPVTPVWLGPAWRAQRAACVTWQLGHTAEHAGHSAAAGAGAKLARELGSRGHGLPGGGGWAGPRPGWGSRGAGGLRGAAPSAGPAAGPRPQPGPEPHPRPQPQPQPQPGAPRREGTESRQPQGARTRANAVDVLARSSSGSWSRLLRRSWQRRGAAEEAQASPSPTACARRRDRRVVFFSNWLPRAAGRLLFAAVTLAQWMQKARREGGWVCWGWGLGAAAALFARRGPWAGCRVGEAKNPGPGEADQLVTQRAFAAAALSRAGISVPGPAGPMGWRTPSLWSDASGDVARGWRRPGNVSPTSHSERALV